MRLQSHSLAAICENLNDLYHRIERREPLLTDTDQYITSRMRQALQEAQAILNGYHTFHQQHDNPSGLMEDTFRENFLDQWQKASEAAGKLYALTESTLNRKGSAPGSSKRLSPFIQRIVYSEQRQLRELHKALLGIMGQDSEQIKQMRRPAEIISGLRACERTPEMVLDHLEIIAQWNRLAGRIANIYLRVERRSHEGIATVGDGHISETMISELKEAASLLQSYAVAYKLISCDHPYEKSHHARILNDFSQALMQHLTTALKSMEPSFSHDHTGLSPLFARLAHREYQEIVGILQAARDGIVHEADYVMQLSITSKPAHTMAGLNEWQKTFQDPHYHS